MDSAVKFNLKELVEYNSDSIVSRKILENGAGGQTLFAFDAGQRLSEHSAPFDAIVQVVEGKGEILIEGKPHHLNAGDSIIMPANIPHAVNAKEQFKMLLTMIKG